MLASLIPFFLVARIAVDDDAWKYGPEYVFDVEMNSTTTYSSNFDGAHASDYSLSKIYCRPSGSDGLNCRLEMNRGLPLEINRGLPLEMMNKNKVDMATEEMFVPEGSFEIRFNEQGVDHLIVNDRVNVTDLNNMKLMAERFNIGSDLNGLADGTYDVVENSTIGYCNGTITINHYPSKRMMNKIKNDRYELESLPQLNKVPSETIVIQKTLNLDNCSSYACFFFGSYAKKVIEPDLNSHLASASSRIFVSDYQFVSSMIWTGSYGSAENKNLADMSEHITLSLQDIRPAKGELPKIPNAAKTTIVANAELRGIVPGE